MALEQEELELKAQINAKAEEKRLEMLFMSLEEKHELVFSGNFLRTGTKIYLVQCVAV